MLTGVSRGSDSCGTLPWLFLIGSEFHLLETELYGTRFRQAPLKIPTRFVQQGCARVQFLLTIQHLDSSSSWLGTGLVLREFGKIYSSC